MFFTGIFLYFFYKFTDRWGAALVVAAGLTLFQLVLWLPARRHSLLSFVSAFIPAGVFAQVFATGGLRSCAGRNTAPTPSASDTDAAIDGRSQRGTFM